MSGDRNDPLVYVVFGLCALLVMGVAAKQCGPSKPADLRAYERSATEDPQVASRPRAADASLESAGGDRVAARGRSGSDAAATTTAGRRAEGGSVSAAGSWGTPNHGGRTSGGQVGYAGSAPSRGGGAPAVVRGDSAVADTSTSTASSQQGDWRRGVGTKPAAGRDAAAPAGSNTVLANPDDPPADGDEPVLSLFPEGDNVTGKKDDSQVYQDGVTYDQGEGAVFSTDSQVAIPNAGNLRGEAGSIAFEIKPEWDGSEASDAAFMQLRTPNVWENRLEFAKNGPYLRFLMFDNTGVENGLGYNMSSWAAGERHHVGASWGPDENGQNMLSLFIDGQLVGQRPYEGQFTVPTQPLYVGNNNEGKIGLRGTISNFQGFQQPLGLDRMQQLAGAGARP